MTKLYYIVAQIDGKWRPVPFTTGTLEWCRGYVCALIDLHYPDSVAIRDKETHIKKI